MPVGRWGWGLARARYSTGCVRGCHQIAASLWVAVVVAAFVAGACGSGPGATASPINLGAVMGSLAAASASPTPATATPAPSPAGPTEAASIAADAADADDEASDGASPATSFTPGPTGVAAPPASGSLADRLPGEPDPLLTPGALNPAVTQATIASTICVSGWTATIRPSSSYTTGLKIQQIGLYGYADTATSAYEEDHLISLELGGAPTDSRNLWPEPYAITLADGRSTGAHTKDGFETRLKNQVCGGTITLAQAQANIGVHWVHAYYGLQITSASTAATPTDAAAPVIAPTEPPTVAPVPTDPYAAAKAAGATAVCADGTLSYSKTRSGTCSGHGGVHWWTGNVGAAGPGAH